jgi:2-dehydro-3-deoxyphosphogluconate aldolase/(4S)-4-hydroxy-2-oxoglutarate aldolase
MSDVLVELRARSLVPVVVADDAACAGALADALVAGGLPVAEVTLRTACAFEVIEAIAARADVLVGAGTVLSTDQVDRAVDAGARFIVSPGLSRAVVGRALERGVLALPGVATASEIQAAIELGLAAVKLFPAELIGGVDAIRALAAPFGELSFVPSGGIGPGNLADYLALPAVAAVGGSWMVPRDLVVARDRARLATLVAQAVALAATSRPR